MKDWSAMLMLVIEMWHSEKERQRRGERERERDLRAWPLILSRERSQALKTRSTMTGSDRREEERVQNEGV